MSTARRASRGAGPVSASGKGARAADKADRSSSSAGRASSPRHAPSAQRESSAGGGRAEHVRPEKLVRAAGAIPWRHQHGELQVALVHRARYDDWSWAKGKLDEGEDWPVAALREVDEETGWRVRLGQPLPPANYRIRARAGHGGQPKEVRYWAAEVVGGKGKLRHEIDAVRWVTPDEAGTLLSYPRDRDQLSAVVEADERNELRTWPLLIVRHGKARARSEWDKADWLRPLAPRGMAQSRDIAKVLTAYGVERVVTSSSTRCAQSVAPYIKQARPSVTTTGVLSEEGYEVRPEDALFLIEALAQSGRPTAVCSHGPLFPDLLRALAEGFTHPRREAEVADLVAAAEENLHKGEVLVCHMRGHGAGARIVAVERHLPVR